MCGPDMNREVLSYMSAGITDTGLTNILKEFQALHPYLTQIAHANRIKDPFDSRVVEAYWLGNELLETIPAKIFHNHLVENIQIKKKIKSRQFEELKDKLREGALMHHSFHVCNVWKQEGNAHEIQTLKNMDNCRISYGNITNISSATITVMRKPLLLINNQLIQGKPIKTKIMRQLEGSSLLDNMKKNDIISIHWGTPCEVITKQQAENLDKYTNLSLALANKTL